MALKHKARPETLKNTSPKSKVQPKEKPMEKAGFDRVITDSSTWHFYTIKWYVNQSATVIEFCLSPKLSLYLIMIVIAWLEIACLNVFHQGNIIIQFFPHNKTWSTVFALSAGEGLGQFLLGMCRWPPTTPSLYSKFSFLAFIIKPRYILVHFFSIFYSVIFNYFIVRCSILTDIAPFKYF